MLLGLVCLDSFPWSKKIQLAQIQTNKQSLT